MSLPEIDDFHRLFTGGMDLLDVRAPVEYMQGAFPHSLNIPLMNDEERHQVGLCYKQKGQEKAIELGHRLVSGEVKADRVKAWAAFFEEKQNAALYCFRGGMRSKITQQWLYEYTGNQYPRVKGGYRAMRRYLLQQLEQAEQLHTPFVLSGRTGVGKTLLLNQLTQKIDLEGMFHHRGSVFGVRVKPQPAQIDIENRLAIELLTFQKKKIRTLIFEDESANIGARRIPETVFNMMRSAPVLLLEASSEERIDIIFDEYITQALAEHCQFYGEAEGFDRWAAYLTTALDKIQRRLGGKDHKTLSGIMRAALDKHARNNEPDAHKEWIARLLFDYYDPMYDYQLSRKLHRVIFKGNKTEMLHYLSTKKQIS